MLLHPQSCTLCAVRHLAGTRRNAKDMALQACTVRLHCRLPTCIMQAWQALHEASTGTRRPSRHIVTQCTACLYRLFLHSKHQMQMNTTPGQCHISYISCCGLLRPCCWCMLRSCPHAAAASKPRVVRTLTGNRARSSTALNASTRARLGRWNSDSPTGFHGMRFTWLMSLWRRSSATSSRA
jgi:hypothetical protein